MHAVKSFIEDISRQKSGFSFGEPWRYEDSTVTCVIPVLRESVRKRAYLTLGEARKIEIIDKGNIERILIVNHEEMPVFIRMGELLAGDTQERASVMSRIVMPGTKEDIDVVCIHASRGIREGASMKSEGFAPAKEPLFSEALYNARPVSQGESWAKDSVYARKVAEFSESRASRSYMPFSYDDLRSALEKAKSCSDDLIRKMPILEDQTGIAIIDRKGVQSIESFEMPESWRATRDELLGKEALKLSERDEAGLFEFRPERAVSHLRGILRREFGTRIALEAGPAKTVAIDDDDYAGQAVMLGSEVIHLCLARKDPEEPAIF